MEKKKKKASALTVKLDSLVRLLKQMQSVLVAYSGGADSNLLLAISHQALGGKVLAVTANSPIYPQEELAFARRQAAQLGIKHRIIRTNQLCNPAFVKNSLQRCYHCKKELFSRLGQMARRYKYNYVIDASNVSDSKDFRPGSQAKNECNVRSPFEECAITKQDIYGLSKMLGLATKDKPATVCLASRIPYGQLIKIRELNMIEKAERYIKRLGFKQVRVRHYNFKGDNPFRLARLEIDKKYISGLKDSTRKLIIRYLKRLGYDYITLDLEGYRLSGGRPLPP